MLQTIASRQPDDYKAKQAARTSAAKALQAANPHLVPVGDQRGKNDSLNAAAKNIRIELARAFPRVKFSVKTRRFSGGDAIDVSWIDGPMTAQVDEIIGRYQAGSFDGMTDCYTYGRDAWTDAFGDAKFVHAARRYSDAAIESVLRTLRAKYASAMAKAEEAGPITATAFREGKLPRGPFIPGSHFGDDLSSMVWQTFSRRTWALNKAPAMPAELPEEVAA